MGWVLWCIHYHSKGGICCHGDGDGTHWAAIPFAGFFSPTGSIEHQFHDEAGHCGASHQLSKWNVQQSSCLLACLFVCLFAGKEAFNFCPSIPLGSLELGFWFSLRYGRLTISQFHDHVQVNNSGGLLDNQTWQTEWKTVSLANRLLQPRVTWPATLKFNT